VQNFGYLCYLILYFGLFKEDKFWVLFGELSFDSKFEFLGKNFIWDFENLYLDFGDRVVLEA
jgi:hypothetical protein